MGEACWRLKSSPRLSHGLGFELTGEARHCQISSPCTRSKSDSCDMNKNRRGDAGCVKENRFREKKTYPLVLGQKMIA